jgi:hypothetical protein
MYWKDKLYVMWIDKDQMISIDHAMLNDDLIRNELVTAERPSEYWVEVQRRFMIKYNSRFGETKQSYNPYMWQRELIFNTEQDAIKFCLKVL